MYHLASSDRELLYLYLQASLYRQNKEETPLDALLSRSGFANLTVCPRCSVDDFVHVEGCEFIPSEDSSDPKKYLLEEPIRAFLIPGARPELKGLKVAFDSKGFMALRCLANPLLAFILTPEASITLSRLIAKEQLGENLKSFYLAHDTIEEDNG